MLPQVTQPPLVSYWVYFHMSQWHECLLFSFLPLSPLNAFLSRTRKLCKQSLLSGWDTELLRAVSLESSSNSMQLLFTWGHYCQSGIIHSLCGAVPQWVDMKHKASFFSQQGPLQNISSYLYKIKYLSLLGKILRQIHSPMTSILWQVTVCISLFISQRIYHLSTLSRPLLLFHLAFLLYMITLPLVKNLILKGLSVLF